MENQAAAIDMDDVERRIDTLRDPWSVLLDDYFSGMYSASMISANNPMEDEALIEKGNNFLFVGLYDGHCGTKASTFLRKELFHALFGLIKGGGTVTAVLIQQAITSVWREYNAVTSNKKLDGSSCLLFLQWNRTIFVANVGDSRAIIGVKNDSNLVVPEQLSREELVAVEGRLDVPKALGDFWITDPSLTQISKAASFKSFTPSAVGTFSETTKIVIRELKNTDEFVVIGSKGFWENMTTGDCVVQVNGTANRSGVAKGLIRSAIRNALRKRDLTWEQLLALPINLRNLVYDDISVFVVYVRRTDNNSICGCRKFETIPSLFNEL